MFVVYYSVEVDGHKGVIRLTTYAGQKILTSKMADYVAQTLQLCAIDAWCAIEPDESEKKK